MKKIFLCIILFLIVICTVHAEDTISIRKEYTPMFSTKTTADGQRFNAQLFYLYEGDRVVYCIEPGVSLEDVAYAQTSSFKEYNIPDTLKRELELIAYYGYEYDHHQHLYYYMATQELIWEKMGATDIVWNTGSQYLTDVTPYKSEIMNLVERHTILPSFANQTFTFKVGMENELLDTNDVLFRFESKDIAIDTTKLHFKSDVPKEEEYHFSYKRKSGSSLLFLAPGSQKVALFRLSDQDDHPFTVKVKFEKEKGNIVISKKDSITEEPLKGVVFGLYDENHTLLDMKETNEKGEIVWEQIEYGKYYIREMKTAKGYVLGDEELEIHLKEAMKEIQVLNQKQEMPITSNIDLIYFGICFILLGVGLWGIYVFKKTSKI